MFQCPKCNSDYAFDRSRTGGGFYCGCGFAPMDTVPLALIAEAWWVRQEKKIVPERGTPEWDAMYEQWTEFAFSDMRGKGKKMGKKKSAKPEPAPVTCPTPGPWRAVKSLFDEDKWIVETRHDGYKDWIAVNIGGSPDHPGGPAFQGTREANAKLMSAALELYEFALLYHSGRGTPEMLDRMVKRAITKAVSGNE